MWIKREYKQLPSCSVRDVSWLICIPSAGTHAGNTSSKSRDVTRTQQEYNNLIEFSVEMIPTGHVALGAVQLFCGHCNLPGDSLHVTSLPISVAWDGLVCLMSWTKDQWALMSQETFKHVCKCTVLFPSANQQHSLAVHLTVCVCLFINPTVPIHSSFCPPTRSPTCYPPFHLVTYIFTHLLVSSFSHTSVHYSKPSTLSPSACIHSLKYPSTWSTNELLWNDPSSLKFK